MAESKGSYTLFGRMGTHIEFDDKGRRTRTMLYGYVKSSEDIDELRALKGEYGDDAYIVKIIEV